MEKIDFASTDSVNKVYDYLEREKEENLQNQLAIVKGIN